MKANIPVVFCLIFFISLYVSPLFSQTTCFIESINSNYCLIYHRGEKGPEGYDRAKDCFDSCISNYILIGDEGGTIYMVVNNPSKELTPKGGVPTLEEAIAALPAHVFYPYPVLSGKSNCRLSVEDQSLAMSNKGKVVFLSDAGGPLSNWSITPAKQQETNGWVYLQSYASGSRTLIAAAGQTVESLPTEQVSGKAQAQAKWKVYTNGDGRLFFKSFSQPDFVLAMNDEGELVLKEQAINAGLDFQSSVEVAEGTYWECDCK
jgi:hypothetical protein